MEQTSEVAVVFVNVVNVNILQIALPQPHNLTKIHILEKLQIHTYCRFCLLWDPPEYSSCC